MSQTETLMASQNTPEPAAAAGRSRVASMLLSLAAIAVADRVIFFVGTVYTRRVLGAAAVGEYNWTAAVMTYFLLLINPGRETIAKREVSRDSAQAARY